MPWSRLRSGSRQRGPEALELGLRHDLPVDLRRDRDDGRRQLVFENPRDASSPSSVASTNQAHRIGAVVAARERPLSTHVDVPSHVPRRGTGLPDALLVVRIRARTVMSEPGSNPEGDGDRSSTRHVRARRRPPSSGLRVQLSAGNVLQIDQARMFGSNASRMPRRKVEARHGEEHEQPGEQADQCHVEHLPAAETCCPSLPWAALPDAQEAQAGLAGWRTRP